MIDLTTLEGADTPGKVRGLAAKALVPDPSDPTTPRPAAVCVYGDMVATAKEALGSSGVKVAAVATAFPSGRASLPVKLADTADAVKAGADEIDMVIDRGAFLAGDYLTVFSPDRRGQGRSAAAPGSRSSWRPASSSPTTTCAAPRGCRCSAAATSSRPPPARSPPPRPCRSPSSCSRPCATGARRTGEMVGVKPAGGIRTSKDAIKFLVTVNEVAGEDWLDNHWFRFGASSLLNDLILQRQRMTHRRLLRRRLRRRRLPQPLLTDRPTDRDPAPPDRGTRDMPPSSTRRPPSRGPSSTSRAATACTSAGSSSRPPAARRSRRSTRPPRRCSPRCRRRAPTTWMPRCGPRAPRTPASGRG